MDALIRYVCTEPRHASAARAVVGDLAVHAGSWAFCPADERSGHSWKDVEGIGVEGLAPFGLRAPSAPEARSA